MPDKKPIQPLAGSVGDVATAFGVRARHLRPAIRAGKIKSFKVGTRRIVEVEAVRRWLRTNPQA